MAKKIAKEAHAYTPGLKVKRAEKVVKTRLLPIKGEVLCKVQDIVDFDTVIAKTELPGDPHFVPASDLLGFDIMDDKQDMLRYILKKEGEQIKKGELIAKFSALFGLIKKEVPSPIDGIIESISGATGRVVVRAYSTPLEITAYIPGEVKEVIPDEGAVIETNSVFIQGILGIGGECHGELTVIVDSPNERITEEKITPDLKGKVVVGGSIVTGKALKRAIELGVKAVIVGGIEDVDLIALLGYELGVAITGHEEVGITLIITEGYGEMTMAQQTFDIFKEFEGSEAAVNGATQIRAGVLRPEIVIPHTRYEPTTKLELTGGMKPGTPIRVIREPYFGELATVVNLPVDLQKVESESRVRVVMVELTNGEQVVVPRANVEIIEE